MTVRTTKRQMAEYQQRMRALGYRVTPQRQLVLEAIRECGGHAAATDVYQRVSSRSPAVNRATVYRVLDFLCDIRLVTRALVAGRTVFEIVGDQHHHHLVCRGCGRMEALGDHHFEALGRHLQDEHGFQADLDHLAIHGLCRECQP